MHIAERALHRSGPRTLRRQPQQRKARMLAQPLLDRVGFMHTVVVHDPIKTRSLVRGVRGVQQSQEIPTPAMVFARTEAIEHLACRPLQCPSQRMLLVLAWRPALFLRGLWPPGRPTLQQEMDITGIGTAHHLWGSQGVGMQSNTSP